MGQILSKHPELPKNGVNVKKLRNIVGEKRCMTKFLSRKFCNKIYVNIFTIITLCQNVDRSNIFFSKFKKKRKNRNLKVKPLTEVTFSFPP